MRNGGHPRPRSSALLPVGRLRTGREELVPLRGMPAASPQWRKTVAGERPRSQDAVHHRCAAAARWRRARTAGATCSPARQGGSDERRGARRSTRNGSGEQCTARRTVGLRPVSAVVAVAASVQTPRQLPAEPGNLFFTSNASAEMTLVHGTAHRRRHGTRGWEGRRRRLARTSVWPRSTGRNQPGDNSH